MIAVFLAKHPKLLLLSIAVIVATGLTSVFVIPRLEDPTLRKRVAVISTVYAGADAQQVESLVTIVLEEQLATISEIKQVRSNSRTNTSNIVIELNDSVNDTDAVWSTVRDRVKDTTTRLPESCGEPKLEIFPLKAFATIVAVTWNRDDDTNWSVMRRITKKLRERLLAIPGTEDLQVFGDSGEEFVAEVTPERLASLGMSTGAIAQQLAGALADQPAGSINSDGSALQLEVIRGGSPEALIKEAPITYGPRGATTTLADIADVRRQIIAPPTYKAIIDDQPAVVLGAMVSDQLRVDHWADEFDLVIEKFAAEHQNDVAIEVLFSQRKQVDLRMNTLLLNLAMGTLAVLVAVLLFMGWRSTLVVSAALPLSALMVLGGMRLLGIPIHQMSITGLIIALGLLIDNAIVIVEEVRAKLVRGETTSTAISESVRHLGMPLFASTLTTALAFLPIATLPGPSGEFVATIAISVILAISASFILSMTIIPAMQSSLYSESPTQGWFGAGITIPLLSRIYQTTLRWIYTVPLFGAAIGLVLPVLGFVAAQQLPQQFFPPSDRQQIQIEIEGSIRDTLQQTEKTSQAVREIVAEHQSVARQYWFLGGSAPTFFYNVVPRRRSTPSYGQAFIDLKSDAEIDRVVRELQAALDREILESRVLVRQLEQGPPFDAPIELRLIGPDFATLHDQGVELRQLLSDTNNVIHTRADLGDSAPKLALVVNRAAASDAGFTKAEIAKQVYAAMEGAPAGKVFDQGEEVPVSVRMNLESSPPLELLAATQLYSPRRRAPAGGAPTGPPGAAPTSPSIPTVASLTEFRFESNIGAIVRIDGRRVNEVKAYIQAGTLPSVVMKEFRQRLQDSSFQLIDGYSLEFGGEVEKRSEAVDDLVANSVILFALMALILVALFRSFRCAFIIATVGGLSAGLGPLGLYLFDFPFGFMAIVGTMGLIGVAINDSIVVLAAIRASDLCRRGDVKEMSIVVSGCTRHVLATTFTTIVGFMPLIIAGGRFWPPLAVAIACGVGGSTLLAIYFVPSFYLLLHRKRRD